MSLCDWSVILLFFQWEMKMKKVVEEVKDVIHLMNYKNILEG